MNLTELTRKSRDAAQLRAYQTHVDVVALRIELVRAWSARIIWAGVVLGLAFTMTNVQQFAANGAPAWSLSWLSAWLLDPMVSLVLIGVLVAEQVTSRWEIDTPMWGRLTKWFTLTATYVMNTWQSWFALSAAGIVKHSVPPLLVFAAVEGGPAMREALTKAVARSLMLTGEGSVTGLAVRVHDVGPDAVHEPTHEPVHEPASEPVREPAPVAVREPRSRRSVNARKSGRAAGSRTGKRVLFADYLAMAREHLTTDVTVTPAWCRQVTGCSAGTSVRLAAALSAEPRTEPPAGAPADTAADAPVEVAGALSGSDQSVDSAVRDSAVLAREAA